MLFGRDKSVIGKHVRNVFLEGELPREGFRQILPKTSVVGDGPEVFHVQGRAAHRPSGKVGEVILIFVGTALTNLNEKAVCV